MDSKTESGIWEEAKAGIIPGVISTSIFLILIFLHFLWKFYVFQNIPWTLSVVVIAIIGISVLGGLISGLVLGAIDGLLDGVLPEDNLKRIISFPLLITLIIAPLILWQIIWGKFIVLYIFTSLVIWTAFKIKFRKGSEKQKKGRSLLLGMAFIIIVSIGAVAMWFEQTDTTPDKLLGDVTLSGVVGNSSLTSGFTESGRMSLFAWPTPSYYDHVDYLGKKNENGDFKAEPEMGVFSGVQVNGNNSVNWFWEGNWEHTNYYENNASNIFVTVSENPDLGLKVTTNNFVHPEENVVIRNYELEKENDSEIENLTFFSYSNFHPTTGKIPLLPLSDYFQREPVQTDFPILKNSRNAYYKDNSIVFTKEKSFSRTNDESQTPVYVGVTASSEIEDYQVGTLTNGGPEDAFDDCNDGTLTNSSSSSKMVNGAFSTQLDDEDSSVTLYYAASDSEEQTLELLGNARKTSYSTQLDKNREWWDNWLSKASMPDTNNENILEVAERSLITIRNAYDKDSGAILASVSRQPPYFLDWPRDGAFLNYALDQAGYHGMVEKHNKYYANIQRASGTWGMNYFPDGKEGGPILFEIDETGLTIWSMWKHYEMTGDHAYLENVYPSMRKAANFLTEWKDPSSNLQFYAHEDDNPVPSQTMNGAVTVYLGLKSAIKAGEAVGENEDTLQRWRKRKSGLRSEIEKEFSQESVTGIPGGRSSWIVWPTKFENFENEKMEHQAEIVWDTISESMNSETVGSSDAYEIMDILSLAHMWTDNEVKENRLKESLQWWAEGIATEDTKQFGEFHYLVRENNELVWRNKIAIPHAWNHALFYSAAMTVYGSEDNRINY